MADLAELWRAIDAGDYERLEGLRDRIDPSVARALAGEWSASWPWSRKDAFVTLVMDVAVARAPELRPVMEDALGSPTPETRAYAVCSLTGEWALFDRMLVGGMVDARAVDAVIAAWRSGRR